MKIFVTWSLPYWWAHVICSPLAFLMATQWGHISPYLLYLHLVKLFLKKIIYWKNLTFFPVLQNIHKKNMTFITSFLIHNCLSDHLCEQIIACGFFSKLPIIPRHLDDEAGFISHTVLFISFDMQ